MPKLAVSILFGALALVPVVNAVAKPVGIPGRFIVEFKAAHLAARDSSSNDTAVDELLRSLAEVEVPATAVANFTSDVFAGASIKVANHTEGSIIEALPQVERVWPVYEIPVPKLLNVTSVGSSTPPYNPHLQTGVDKLHREGVLGAGSIVAVIDSGVDWTHPALGSGYGEGFKIEGGYDFIGDGIEPEEDSDPYDEWEGHGTHVTGIIAGESERFVGVAPKARIRVYKVVGRFITFISTDILIMAHIKAYEDGADIISTSIGDSSGWPYGAWEVTCERIAQKGVIVVNAAGNSGDAGTHLVSGGASPEHVVAVASAESDQLPGIAAVIKGVNGTAENVPYLTLQAVAWPDRWGPTKSGMPLHSPLGPNGERELYTACGIRDDDWTHELEHKVVLLRRSSNCSFVEQARAAVSRGSQFVLFINDDSAPVIPNAAPAQVEVGLLTKTSGDLLEKRLMAGENITISFPDFGPAFNFETNFLGPHINEFSSWGLGNEGSLKPDIAAPGGRILSTYPKTLGTYLIASGTSMATPYIAGIAALYLSAHGGRATLGVEGTIALAASLSSAGNPIFWNDGAADIKYPAPAQQQGGGLVDAYRFVRSTTQVFPNRIQLNHTGANALRTRFDITVKNNGLRAITFQVNHLPSPSVYTYTAENPDEASYFPPTLIKDLVADIDVGDANFTVNAGASRVLRFRFVIPTGFVEERLPVISGFVVLTGSNGDTISVPYAGIATDGKKIQPLTSAGAFWVHAQTGEDIVEGANVTLSNGYDIAAQVGLRYGTKIWRVEVVEADKPLDQLKYPGEPGKDGLVGVAVDLPYLGRPGGPFRWGVLLSDRFVNGTLIPTGRWRYVTRILRPFWKPEDRGAWELRASPVINVQRDVQK